MAASPEPIQLSIPETALADLKARRAMTRFPDQAPDGPWAYGTDLEYMRSLVGYWRQFRLARAGSRAERLSPVQGQAARHRRARPARAGTRAITHATVADAWLAGAVFEFINIIPRLTDPARLGHAHPQNLIGIHVNLLAVLRDLQPRPSPTEEERRYYEEQTTWLREETGYQWIQGTKPQTLAYAQTDSPVGRPTPAPAE
jgi:hypothetical protein